MADVESIMNCYVLCQMLLLFFSGSDGIPHLRHLRRRPRDAPVRIQHGSYQRAARGKKLQEIFVCFLFLSRRFVLRQVIEDFIRTSYAGRYGVDIAEGREKIIFSIAVSIFAIGGMIGGFGGGYVANRFGR